MKVKRIFEIFIVSILVFVLSGCSFALDRSITKKISDEKLVSSVAKIVDEQLEVVSPYFEENSRDIDIKEINGEQVVLNAMDEEQGEQYLRFNYSIAIDYDQNIDEIASQAKALLPESEAIKIDEKLYSTKNFIKKDIVQISKTIPPSQQIAFQKDLRKLVTRSFVLFTAGIVYAFIL